MPQSAQSHSHLCYLYGGVYVVCFSTSPAQPPAVTRAQGMSIRRHGSDVYLGMTLVQNGGSYVMY